MEGYSLHSHQYGGLQSSFTPIWRVTVFIHTNMEGYSLHSHQYGGLQSSFTPIWRVTVVDSHQQRGLGLLCARWTKSISNFVNDYREIIFIIMKTIVIQFEGNSLAPRNLLKNSENNVVDNLNKNIVHAIPPTLIFCPSWRSYYSALIPPSPQPACLFFFHSKSSGALNCFS